MIGSGPFARGIFSIVARLGVPGSWHMRGSQRKASGREERMSSSAPRSTAARWGATGEPSTFEVSKQGKIRRPDRAGLRSIYSTG